MRSTGGIADKVHIDPANLGLDGISAACSNCTAKEGKFWGYTVSQLQDFAKQIGLDPQHAAEYTPQFGGKDHWSLFTDAFGTDGKLLPEFADKIDQFLRAGTKVKK